VIATEAICATLRWINEDVFPNHGLADSFGDILFFEKWFACGFGFDEFDPEKQAEAPDFPNVWMSGQWRQSFAKMFRNRLDASEKILCFKNVENGVARGGGNGMGLVGETVLKSARTFCKGFRDAGGDQDCSERSVTARDAFADENQVWISAPMLNGEGFSGAAHAGHDFVGDKKNISLATDFRDAFYVAVRRGCRAQRCADNRFEDESGNG